MSTARVVVPRNSCGYWFTVDTWARKPSKPGNGREGKTQELKHSSPETTDLLSISFNEVLRLSPPLPPSPTITDRTPYEVCFSQQLRQSLPAHRTLQRFNFKKKLQSGQPLKEEDQRRIFSLASRPGSFYSILVQLQVGLSGGRGSPRGGAIWGEGLLGGGRG